MAKNGKKTPQTFVKIAEITAKTRQRHGIKSRAQRPLYVCVCVIACVWAMSPDSNK